MKEAILKIRISLFMKAIHIELHIDKSYLSDKGTKFFMFEEELEDMSLKIGKVLNDESISLWCPVDDLSVIGVLDLIGRVYVEYLEDISQES